jgi:hypothetical protein
LTWDGTSLTATKLAGAHNGTVGATTPSTGDFTSVTGTVSSGAVATYTASGANQSIYSRYIGGSPSAANVYVGADTAAGGISGLGGVGLLWNVGNRALAFGTNNALAMSLSTTGALALKDASTSATGVGITFPATQSASTDANTLDDYEEGTWTPTLAFGGGSTGIVYGGRVGNYIKVGSLITAQCAVDITNKGSSTGSASVSGFPFTVSGTFITHISSQLVSWTGAGPCQLLLSSGTTASFYGIPNGVGFGWTALTNTDFANTSQFYFTMVYKV